jgi:hypothetical protein
MVKESSAVDRQTVRETIDAALKSGVSALDASQSMALLGAYGVPLAEQTACCGREFLVGMRRDPVFGPVVAFGLGGVFAEAVHDGVLALAPVDDRAAAELPDLIKAVAECEAVDALIVLSDAETSVLSRVAELMESTGKPIIPVPDFPSQGSVFDLGKKYGPVVVSSVGVAALALDRMEWFASHRREHSPLA